MTVIVDGVKEKLLPVTANSLTAPVVTEVLIEVSTEVEVEVSFVSEASGSITGASEVFLPISIHPPTTITKITIAVIILFMLFLFFIN